MFGLPLLSRTLAAALRDVESKRPEIRRSALVDLARFAESSGRQQVVEVLGRMLQSDPDVEVRAMVAIAIADFALIDLVPSLLVALEDREPRVQQMALLALGEVGRGADTRAAEGIRRLLRSPLPALRYQALVAWSRLMGNEGMAQLVSALDDHDTEVRWIAWSLVEERIDALLPTRDVRFATPKDDNRERLAATEVESLAAQLRPHVEDGSPRVLVIAASVMHRLGDSSHMARLLVRVDRTNGVRREDLVAMIQRLGRLRYEPARQWLTRRARRGWFEGPLGWPATVALAALGDASAESGILRELDSLSVRRRVRALEAIRELALVVALEKVRALPTKATGIEPWQVEETLRVLEPSAREEHAI